MLLMVQLPRMSHRNTTNFQSIPLPISQADLFRRKSATLRYGLMLAVLLVVCLLAGCGPETADGQDELTTNTGTIALNYQNHRNLTQANAELAELPVANVNQWLLFVTETAVTNNSDPTQTNALVALVMDLGLQSNTIYAYAVQHNLVAAASQAVALAGKRAASMVPAVMAEALRLPMFWHRMVSVPESQ